MRFQDTIERYGNISKSLHWLTAVLLLFQITSPLANHLWTGNAFSRSIQPWHATIGVTILGLTALRIFWLFLQIKSRPKSDNIMKTIGHGAIYLLLLAVPSIGFMMLLEKGYGVQIFGVRILSEIQDVSWPTRLNELHAPFAWMIAILVVGHVAMAFHHHFIHRDETLRRMI